MSLATYTAEGRPKSSALTIPFVSVLPSSPYNGQEIFYLADATNGVTWHLSYRSAEAGSYKWYCIGGSPLIADTTSSANTSSTSFVTIGPSFTIPLAGDYMIACGAMMSNNASPANTIFSYKVGAATASDDDGAAAMLASPTNLHLTSAWTERRKTGIAASTVIDGAHRVSNGSGNTMRRRIIGMPVRVG